MLYIIYEIRKDKKMRKRMFMGKLTPLDQIYSGDFEFWGGEIISLQHNNSKVFGRVIETRKDEYHLIITKENKMICVEWSENDEKTNSKIFHEYDFGHPSSWSLKNTHPNKQPYSYPHQYQYGEKKEVK